MALYSLDCIWHSCSTQLLLSSMLYIAGQLQALTGSVLQIPLTGLFAGLTLGLLSLDIVGLKVCLLLILRSRVLSACASESSMLSQQS